MHDNAVQLSADCQALSTRFWRESEPFLPLVSRAAERAGCEVLQAIEQVQDHQHSTCVVLLSSGSISVHVDHRKQAFHLDVMCFAQGFDPEVLLDQLKLSLQVDLIESWRQPRGHQDRSRQRCLLSSGGEPTDELTGDASAIRAALLKAKTRYRKPVGQA